VSAIEQAQAYIQQGWCVTPIKPRQKRPELDNWPQVRIGSDEVPRYFKPNSNIGVVLGDASGGLVDIDLDCPEAVALAPQILPPTIEFGRPSARRSHWLYQARGARTEKFQELDRSMLVELRANKTSAEGEGMQTVFPGSVHESGELVTWEEDSASAEAVELTPEKLRRLVAQLAAAALLMKHGWTHARAAEFGRNPRVDDLRDVNDKVYERVARWLGYPAREQRRAPAPAPRPREDNRLKRASAYLAKVPAAISGQGGHDNAWKAALSVVVGFDLDEASAYRLLASEYNPRCSPPWNERELQHKVRDAANNARLERGYLLKAERPQSRPNGAPAAHHQPAAAAAAAPAEWEPPVEFGVFDLPPFPVEVLPPVLSDFVRALAIATQTPADLAGMMVLAACAAVCAKRIVVEVKPGYREPTNLFTLAVLPSGHRKSAVIEEVSRPLREWEGKEAEKVAPEIAKHAQRWAISKRRLEHLSDRAAKAKTKGEKEQLELEIEGLAEEHSKLNVPAEPRILADDVTPEALGSLLATHGGRIAILSAEGGVFQQMAGKYSDSPSLDVYLKAHVGDEIRVDRKGRASERVSKPALTLGISPQPIILEALAEKQMLRGTGLLARFLYALPTSMLGARTGDPPPMPDAVRSAYASALRRLLLLQQQDRTLTLTFSHQAYETWREFYLWVEPQLGEGGDLESISDWGSKLPGAVARIAGILRILGILALDTHSEDPSILINIERDEVVRAAALGKYLVPHARAAFSSMGADPRIQGAKQLLKTIRRKGWSSFTRRELQQSVKGSERFNDADQLDTALHVLEERGFIRPTSSPSMSERGRGRPPGTSYEVNPYLDRQKYQNSQNSDVHP
jgi:replicative DNA helicase